MPLPSPGQLLILLTGLFVLFRGLEWLRPKHERTKLWRPGLVTDLAYWVFNTLIAERIVRAVVLVVILALAWLLYGQLDRSQILAGFGPLGALSLGAQIVLMLVIGDFVGYWSHRVFHTRRLWKFHAIHHAPTTLDWLSAARMHPVNEIGGRIAAVAVLMGLGFKLDALVWAGPIFGLFALFLHANLDWDYGRFRTVLASPRFHRWHHTSDAEGRDKNFAALFPVWDILFGTYFMPAGEVPRRFGTDTLVPPTFFGQLMFPFRSARREGQR